MGGLGLGLSCLVTSSFSLCFSAFCSLCISSSAAITVDLPLSCLCEQAKNAQVAARPATTMMPINIATSKEVIGSEPEPVRVGDGACS